MVKVLTIAGSDSSGGAGIQADLKTMTAHCVYGMSVITALTAQNTTGVYGILNVPESFVRGEIDAVFSDITPDAVKVGMVSETEIIKAIADKMIEYSPKRLVVDPVMISTSGYKLLSDEAMETLLTRLLPLADIVTPNIHEAEAITGIGIKSKSDAEKAAIRMRDMGMKNILIKGGHSERDADDLFYGEDGRFVWLSADRIDNRNTHGTGCTLSSAIACDLALGYDMLAAVKNAKAYVFGAIADNMDLGHGDGPLNHVYNIPKSVVVTAEK